MEYKAFRIGALFEKLNAPYIGAGRKQDNVSTIDGQGQICLTVCLSAAFHRGGR